MLESCCCRGNDAECRAERKSWTQKLQTRGGAAAAAAKKTNNSVQNQQVVYILNSSATCSSSSSNAITFNSNGVGGGQGY